MNVKKHDENESLKNRNTEGELNISSTGYGLEATVKTPTIDDPENEQLSSFYGRS
jgi:hypothetical protein